MTHIKMKRAVAALAMVAVLFGVTGCVREPLPESMRIDTRPFQIEKGSGSNGVVRAGSETFELNGASDAKVELGMGAGEMVVRSGNTSALADVTFKYGDVRNKPKTAYNVSGSTGELTISQPEVHYKFGDAYPNSWNIALAQGVPLELSVQMGAGSSELDLSELDVRDLLLRLGAGETEVDLTGPRTEDVKGDIQAGVGQLTILLPKDVGVRVTGAKNGVGDIVADGFTVQGDAYVNDAYGNTPTSIELTVMRGVGEVKLELQ